VPPNIQAAANAGSQSQLGDDRFDSIEELADRF